VAFINAPAGVPFAENVLKLREFNARLTRTPQYTHHVPGHIIQILGIIWGITALRERRAPESVRLRSGTKLN